jgi:hypothetical protein
MRPVARPLIHVLAMVISISAISIGRSAGR